MAPFLMRMAIALGAVVLVGYLARRAGLLEGPTESREKSVASNSRTENHSKDADFAQQERVLDQALQRRSARDAIVALRNLEKIARRLIEQGPEEDRDRIITRTRSARDRVGCMRTTNSRDLPEGYAPDAGLCYFRRHVPGQIVFRSTGQDTVEVVNSSVGTMVTFNSRLGGETYCVTILAEEPPEDLRARLAGARRGFTVHGHIREHVLIDGNGEPYLPIVGRIET